MKKNIIFWGAKFKAGIIYDLIVKNKILANSKKLSVKFLFDPNLKKPQFGSKAEFTNDVMKLKNFVITMKII